MNSQTASTSGTHGHSTAEGIFVLTDEQILAIGPDPQDVQIHRSEPEGSSPLGNGARQDESAQASSSAATATSATITATSTPGPGAQAATPAPFSAPEDVRALAELYPGGLPQAKTAAERARTLDEIDAAYFGAASHSPGQISAARAQLAQRMLREDPAAFREMVFAGLRALDAAGNPPVAATLGQPAVSPSAGATDEPSPAQTAAIQQGHPGASQATPSRAELAQQAQLAAYGAFEKAANEDLEKSVGGAIERTLRQALPHGDRPESAALSARLSATIRTDVEKALQGDRQLSEQVAQLLSARRFDNETRAQVVRLINERAQQLVPSAARRALSDWTQATLAAHRARTRSAEASASRADVLDAAGQGTRPDGLPAQTAPGAREEKNRAVPPRATPSASRGSSRVDYQRLSDEQILDL